MLDLFLDWKQYEIDHGRNTADLDALLLVLQPIGKGYCLLDPEDLYGLLKAAWLKPGHSEKDFRGLYEKYLEKIRKGKTEDTSREDAGKRKPPTEAERKQKEAQQKRKEEEARTGEKEAATDRPLETIPEEQETVTLSFQAGGTGLEGLSADTDRRDLMDRIFSKPYIIRGHSYLLSDRLLQQSWRSMRELAPTGSTREVDLEATIAEVAQHGFLEKVRYRPVVRNESRLIILIDHWGSMAAFQGLVGQVLATAALGKNFRERIVYYFWNTPDDFLYRDPQFTDALELPAFFREAVHPVLIVSDAGAARGHYLPERIAGTEAFLKGLKNAHVAWLNPMPRKRWKNTTAEYIARRVPMFDTSEQEFRNLIKVLRGKMKQF